MLRREEFLGNFYVMQRVHLSDLFIARNECYVLVSITGYVSAYRTAEGEPWVMPFVKKIEQKMANDPKSNHEYLWFLGLDKFTEMAPRLLLGEHSPAVLEGRVSEHLISC
jgi:aspartate/tyrosine/aromatic aminotransferase